MIWLRQSEDLICYLLRSTCTRLVHKISNLAMRFITRAHRIHSKIKPGNNKYCHALYALSHFSVSPFSDLKGVRKVTEWF